MVRTCFNSMENNHILKTELKEKWKEIDGGFVTQNSYGAVKRFHTTVLNYFFLLCLIYTHLYHYLVDNSLSWAVDLYAILDFASCCPP